MKISYVWQLYTLDMLQTYVPSIYGISSDLWQILQIFWPKSCDTVPLHQIFLDKCMCWATQMRQRIKNTNSITSVYSWISRPKSSWSHSNFFHSPRGKTMLAGEKMDSFFLFFLFYFFLRLLNIMNKYYFLLLCTGTGIFPFWRFSPFFFFFFFSKHCLLLLFNFKIFSFLLKSIFLLL